MSRPNMPHKWDSKTNMDLLRYLTAGQLRDLLEDEQSIQSIVRSNKKLQDLQKQKEVKWASNARLAEKNLSYQPYLKNKKRLLAEKYQLLGREMSSLRRKHRKFDRLHGGVSLQAIQRLLNQKVAHITDESENLWQKFLEGNLMLLDFLKLFQSSLKVYYRHLVQVKKIENLCSQTQDQQSTGAASSSGLFSNDLHLQNAVNVFYSLSPVVMLPTTFLPLMGPAVKSSHLPPLNKHSEGNLWAAFMPITNPSQSQRFPMSWLPRIDHIQQQAGAKVKRPKPSQ